MIFTLIKIQKIFRILIKFTTKLSNKKSFFTGLGVLVRILDMHEELFRRIFDFTGP